MFCPPRGMLLRTYALLRTYTLCYAIPRLPTWWTNGAMCYKGLCVIKGMCYEGFNCNIIGHVTCNAHKTPLPLASKVISAGWSESSSSLSATILNITDLPYELTYECLEASSVLLLQVIMTNLSFKDGPKSNVPLV